MDTSKESLVLFVALTHDRDWLFQQNYAPVHRSVYINRYLSQNLIVTITLPARSPDLNPIETEWYILACRIYANSGQYKDVAALK